MDTNDNTFPTDRRPLGFWLRTVDALLTREFAETLADDEITRRDWMLLNALAGSVEAPAPLREKIARGGKRLRALADRGWVTEIDGEWSLTDEGRAAVTRMGERVAQIRTRTAGAVTPEEYATTVASLEAIARELGWTEDMQMPRRRGPGHGRHGRGRHGFGFGFGHGRSHHGRDHGSDPGHGRGFGPGHGDHGHHPHPGHGHHGRPDHHHCGHGEQAPAQRGCDRD